MTERQIGHRKSRLVRYSRDPVVKWRSSSVGKSLNWIHHIRVFATCFNKYLVDLFQTLFDMLLFQSFNMDLLQPAAEAFLALICCHQVITFFLFCKCNYPLPLWGFSGLLVLVTPLLSLSELLVIRDHAQNLEQQLWMRGGRKEVSVLSHRCVTSSEVKTAGFRRSVLTFLNISGCSERKNRMLKSHHFKESFFSF